MKGRAAILGVAQTVHEREKPDQTFADLAFDVVSGALEDAQMTIQDVDTIITVSNDFWDGRTISSMALMDAVGGYGKNVSTVEGDGTFGAFYGLMRVLSGSYRTCLVVAHCKASEGQPNLINNGMFDPIYYRRLGLDALSSAALQARRYMDKYGVSEEQCALVSVKNHGNARRNPCAQMPLDVSVEDVMASQMLAEPIKALDASPLGDGACAMILGDEYTAKHASRRPVWVKGVGTCADAYFLGDRDLAEVDALVRAARTAYDQADVSDPRRDIDVAEVFDGFSYQELMWLEGLGFCERGAAGRLTESGATTLSGRIPVNPSGGVLSAHPPLVAGLVRLAEAALQVRGEAGEHQIDGVRTALAHGTNGPCGQSHCVWIVGR
ncbi:MAG: thiolase family protein [Chloroflexota bacterium]|nr:MAG: thiolase family protein [Chloroflexota bacterium]